MHTLKKLRRKRDEIIALAEKYGVRNIRVFGSVARGEADGDSDVDFLVTFGPGTTLWNVSAFSDELETLLGHKVDVISDRGLREKIKETVLNEAVPL